MVSMRGWIVVNKPENKLNLTPGATKEKDVSVELMNERVNEYLNFNGIGLSSKQHETLLTHLDKFREDDDSFINEMVCEIRTLNGE